MTVDITPQTLRKINAAAARNLEAGDWVAPDPMLDANDPPVRIKRTVQESVYSEALHPRGRGGKWIGKGLVKPPSGPRIVREPPRSTATITPSPPKLSAVPIPKSTADHVIDSLNGKTGDEAYQALASGKALDTQKLHQVDGKYTEARQMLHQHIVDHFFANARPAEGKPTAIFTAGGAASGKSGLAGQAREAEHNLATPDGHVYINPDDIKEMLPEYKALKDRGRSDVAAAAAHEESSDLAKLMTGMAIQGNYPIVVDGTGNSAVGKFGKKLQAAADKGYNVEARYAHVPVDEALRREQLRAQRTGRKVAESLLREQHHTVVKSYADDVLNHPNVHVNVYSTVDRGRPTLIAEKHPGEDLRVHDQAQYADHLSKAKP